MVEQTRSSRQRIGESHLLTFPINILMKSTIDLSFCQDYF